MDRRTSPRRKASTDLARRQDQYETQAAAGTRSSPRFTLLSPPRNSVQRTTRQKSLIQEDTVNKRRRVESSHAFREGSTEKGSTADRSIDTIEEENQRNIVRGKTKANGPIDEHPDQIPVHEVHVTAKAKQGNGANDMGKDTSPQYLDESTLRCVSNYFLEVPDTQLDEVNVLNFTLRMDRLATQQVQSQQRLVGLDTDDDSEMSALYDEIFAEEEEHHLGRDMFRAMVASVEKTQSIKLDKKTLSWIRRASGLHRSSNEGASLSKDDLGPHENHRGRPSLGGLRSETRYTRGMAQKTRVKKSVKGLHLLSSVVDEMETVNGPYPPYNAPKRSSSENLLDIQGGTVIRRDGQGNRKKAKLHGDKIDSTSLLVVPGTGRVKRCKREHNKKPADVPTNIALLYEELQQWRKGSETALTNDLKAYLNRQEKTLPKSYRREGIVYRLPFWDDVSSATGIESSSAPLRERHSDEHYSRNCNRLLRFSFQGNARMWVKYEFFYCDLDRAWYHGRDFSDEVAHLGITPTTKLTLAEWKIVRRAIPRKLRRFSKAFIATELKKRNQHRIAVRLLEKQKRSFTVGNFFSAFIVPGTVVTAYSNALRILKRGRVLLYDEKTLKYLVKFDTAGLDHEFCFDTDITRHGSGEWSLLFDSPLRTANRGLGNGKELKARQQEDAMRTASVASKDVLHNLLTFTPQTSNVPKIDTEAKLSRPVVDQVAERESLVRFMVAMETAKERKGKILDAMQIVQAQIVHCLPFGDSHPRELNLSLPTDEVNAHYKWLRVHLDAINKFIDNSTALFRLMYQGGEEGSPTKVERVDAALSKALCDIRQAPLAQPWLSSITRACKDISKGMVAISQPSAATVAGTPPDASSLHAIANVLCTANYCQDRLKGTNVVPNGIDLVAAMTNAAQSVCSRQSATHPDNALYIETIAARDAAILDFAEAVDLFNAELGLIHVQRLASNKA